VPYRWPLVCGVTLSRPAAIIYLDHADGDLGAGILEFDARVDKPLEMGVKVNIYHQGGGCCSLLFCSRGHWCS
jgi:hypothetical protein